MIRCVIVDDEPLAVSLLTDYVRKTPGLDTVLATTQVLEALQAVQEGRADLIFLDIQMPELTGLQFMKIIRKSCKVILTTAYAQYALEGYEHDVVDYLLKPITLDRFMIAVQKVKERLSAADARKENAMEVSTPPAVALPASIPPPAHIFIKTEYRIQKIDLSAIFYIEALRDYIAIHTAGAKILSLESMKNMEELLPGSQFIRIHKSYIINREFIEFIERGRVVIHKEYLPIGETYREKVMNKLGL
jgi:two-component system LytT family response regulator